MRRLFIPEGDIARFEGLLAKLFLEEAAIATEVQLFYILSSKGLTVIRNSRKQSPQSAVFSLLPLRNISDSSCGVQLWGLRWALWTIYFPMQFVSSKLKTPTICLSQNIVRVLLSGLQEPSAVLWQKLLPFLVKVATFFSKRINFDCWSTERGFVFI